MRDIDMTTDGYHGHASRAELSEAAESARGAALEDDPDVGRIQAYLDGRDGFPPGSVGAVAAKGGTQMDNTLTPGAEIYSVATGHISLVRRASRDGARFMAGQAGFVGVHIVPDGRCLWFYSTRNDAVTARNRAEQAGILCGRNIGTFEVGADGVPEYVEGQGE